MGFDALCPSLLYDCNITIGSSWISPPSICLLIKQQQGCIGCCLLGRVTGKYLRSISKKQGLTHCSITSVLTSVLTIKIHVTIIWQKKRLLRSKPLKGPCAIAALLAMFLTCYFCWVTICLSQFTLQVCVGFLRTREGMQGIDGYWRCLDRGAGITFAWASC